MGDTYPLAGLYNYLFRSALTPFDGNRWANRDDALRFRDGVQEYLYPFAFRCEVVDEFVPDHPAYRWRVMCSSARND